MDHDDVEADDLIDGTAYSKVFVLKTLLNLKQVTGNQGQILFRALHFI